MAAESLGTERTMVRRPIVGFVILLIALGGCYKAPNPDSPSTVVEHFYSTYLPDRQGGLPSGRQLERLRPFLSDNLNLLIVAALRYQERFIASHPDEPQPTGPPVIHKPPFVDGDYFSSMFEGPKFSEIARTEPGPNGSWQVHVHFWYDRALPGWEDVIVVTDQRGRHVIDDVLFSGAGPFNPSGRLSDRLKQRDGQ
jgi:hypothetical protein